MLDDLKLIHTRDAEDALGVALKQWEQYQHQFGFNFQAKNDISNVVVAGMGGSGLAAKAINCWPKLHMPYVIVQDYDLPSFVNENTLLIVSSYSGNTEETLSVLTRAMEIPEDRRPVVVIISSGGKLLSLANEHNLPKISLPTGFQPRMTFGYQFRALCEIFDSVGISKGDLSELVAASNWLSEILPKWGQLIPTKDNVAKQLAQEVIGKSIVIYASDQFLPAAYKWKISFNENAKTVSWWDSYPEFNHNEFLGWTSHPVEKLYSVIDLRSNLDSPEIQKRFVISEQLLSGKRPSPEIVNLEGQTILQQLLWAISLGDFVSLYTAILNGIDPTPVVLIEELKKRLQ